MTGTAAARKLQASTAPTDESLIQGCLQGDEEASSALIDRYANLIYSIPIKLGMYREAPDIFQSVCVELLSNLSQLRDYQALPKWLIQTCYRKCLRQQQLVNRQVELEPAFAESQPDMGLLPEQILVQLEQEQLLRNAMEEMPSRCRQMVHMLFFEVPARPYDEVAKELGLATGSIGFIRGRCLARLKRYLLQRGY